MSSTKSGAFDRGADGGVGFFGEDWGGEVIAWRRLAPISGQRKRVSQRASLMFQGIAGGGGNGQRGQHDCQGENGKSFVMEFHHLSGTVIREPFGVFRALLRPLFMVNFDRFFKCFPAMQQVGAVPPHILAAAIPAHAIQSPVHLQPVLR
jgi:hypothetical protein